MSVAERPAAGLYTTAWILGGFGLGAIAIGYVIEGFDPGLSGLLVLAGLAATLPGFTAAARYQLITRRARPAEQFRGPAPLVLFVLQVAIVNVVSVVVYLLGAPGPDKSSGFLAAAIVLLGGYVFVVWLFVLRTGALNWRELIRIESFTGSRVVKDIAIGGATMFVGAIAAGLFGSVISDLLGGTQAPNVVPTPNSSPDLVLTILGAALLVPIGEELFFRGYAMTAWLRDLGEQSALVRATVFFALIHILNITVAPDAALDGAKQAILVVAVIAPVGLALGWLYLRRGLIASIAGHVAFNLFGILVLVLAQTHAAS